ncbi:MAG: cell division ATP-binding protein FtsE [Bacteroidota bacterium]
MNSDEIVVSVKNLDVNQNDSLVLASVNFSIRKSEFVYLLGKTGSGKSSLMKILYGELVPAKGNASVAGFELETIKNSQIPFLRRKLGIVFQDFQLLSDRDVTDNLKFVMRATGWKDKNEIEKRVVELLAKTGLTGKGSKMIYQLSGGEQQRVAVARALINNPILILADEPTGNLDPETSAEIMNLFRDITNSGTAVLFATHDYLLYEKFPGRTLKCENGKLVELEFHKL